MYALLLLSVPIIFLVLTPTSYKCCRGSSKKKVSNYDSEVQMGHGTAAEKLSMVVQGFNYFVCVLIFVAFTAGNILVFVPQYKFFAGDFLTQGANNEIFTPVFMLLMFFAYR
jgi:hypothetical protein